MNVQTLYIDASEEITTVIEQLKAAKQPIVALVVPKGSVILQSIVNLKLARKAAQDAQKDLILVTTDKIGRNLAVQLGIPVANTEKEIPQAASGEAPEGEESNVVNGVRIHRYYADSPEEEVTAAGGAATTTAATASPSLDAASIIPRSIMTTEPSPTPTPPTTTAATTTPAQATTSTASPTVSSTAAPVTETTVGATTIARRSIDAPQSSTTAKDTAATTNSDTQATANEVAQDTPVGPTPQPITGIPVEQTALRLRKPLFRRILIVAIPVVVIFSGAALAMAYFPKSSVSITVRGEPWQKELSFTAKTSQSQTSPDSLTLPAEELTAETEGKVSFTATGKARIGTKASGTATLYNSQDTTPQKVPAGARITANGLTFTTDQDVTVPGFQKKNGVPITGEATVNITAVAVGEENNLENVGATLVSPVNNNLSINIGKTSGGTSREVVVVSDSDVAKARDELSKKLRTEIQSKIQDKLAGREVLGQDDADVFTLSSFTSSVAVGAEAKTAEVSSKATLSRLVADMAVIKPAIQNRLKDLTPVNQKQVIDQRVDVLSITTDRKAGTLSFTTRTSGKNTPIFSTAAIPAAIAGKSESEALQLVRDKTPSTNVTVTRNPAWWPLSRFPLSSSAITITVQYE